MPEAQHDIGLIYEDGQLGVKQDKSMSAMVQNDSEKSWMEPLLQLRNDLTEKDFEKRDFRRLKGHVQLMGAEDEAVVPGPYTKTSREEWLRKLLQAQNKIRNNNQLPKDLKKIQLINQEELILMHFGMDITNRMALLIIVLVKIMELRQIFMQQKIKNLFVFMISH